MKFTAVLPLLVISSASAFVPQQRATFTRPLRMADDADTTTTPAPPKAKAPPASSSGGALVPIKEETVEFTAGLIGGAAGFVLGGPVLAAIGAAAANYVSKMDGDVSEVVQAVSKSSIEVYNYLAKLDSKYQILDKAKKSLEEAANKLKASDSVDPAALDKVESALASTNSKIKEINEEYDLVGAGVTALGVVGDLVEKAVQKAGELNEEYNLTDKAKAALSNAVDKAKSAAKDVKV